MKLVITLVCTAAVILAFLLFGSGSGPSTKRPRSKRQTVKKKPAPAPKKAVAEESATNATPAAKPPAPMHAAAKAEPNPPAADTSVFFVSPAGSDAAEGRKGSPWKTLAHANKKLQAGETLVLRAGTYHERIEPKTSGAKGKPITFRGHKGEKVVITGGGDHGALLQKIDYITIEDIIFDGEDRVKGGVTIDDRADHITIRGCEIMNHRRKSNTGGYGIRVGRKGASHLLVENCRIYRNGTTNPARQEGGNIRIDGGGDHITIRDCDIYEAYSEDGLHMGAFGAVVVDSLIENCRFWNCKEDAIDIKRVERITIRGCEFWGHRKTVTGGGAGVNIHQSATDILVENCRAWDNMRGIGIAYNLKGGHWPATQRITVRGCVLFDNDTGVVAIGGMPNKPVLGKCKDIKIYNNVFYKNRIYGLELYAHKGGDLVGADVKNNVFLQNLKADYSVSSRVKNVTSDYNCFPAAASSKTINWPGVGAGTLAMVRKSGGEMHSRADEPAFEDPGDKKFNLKPQSPLIDAGTDVGLPFKGKAPDMGAVEFSN